MKLLYIDSDESFAGPLKRSLERGGVAVALHGDGKSGFEAACDEPPDAIVLAVELGDKPTGGYTWCQKLKKDETTRDVPLVLVSSQATPQIFEQHRKLRNRADEYLQKPFDAAMLLHLLDQHVVLPAGSLDACSNTLNGVTAPQPRDLLDADDDLLNLDEAFDLLTTPDAGSAAAPANDDGFELALPNGTAAIDVGEAGPGDDNGFELALSDETAAIDLGKAPAPATDDRFEIALSSETSSVDVGEAPASMADDGFEIALSNEASSIEIGEAPAPATDDGFEIALVNETSAADLGAAPAPAVDVSFEIALPAETDATDTPEDGGWDVGDIGPDELRAQLVAVERRLADAERELSEKAAELEASKGTSGGRDREYFGLRNEISRKDKEILRLREELNRAEREGLELREAQTDLEQQVMNLEAEVARKDALSRTALSRAEAASAGYRRAEGTVSALRTEAARVPGLLEQVEGLLGERRRLETEATSARSKVQAELAATRGELDASRAELEALRAQLEAARGELDGVRAEDVTCRTELAAARGETNDLRTRTTELENQLARCNEELFEARAELEARSAALERARKALTEAMATLAR